MLIEQVFRTVCTPLVQKAFGFGSTKTRPIDFGLFRRLLSFGALLKSLEVDHIPHACPRHATEGESATFAPRRKSSHRASELFRAEWNPAGVKKMLSMNNLARIPVAKPVSTFAERAPAGSVVIRKFPVTALIASKNIFRLAKTNYFVLYRVPAQ
jgi:hypothetical protein